MKLVILDGYGVNPGDLSWDAFKTFGSLTVYDRTASEETISRIGDSEIILTNKTVISKEIIDACPKLAYIGVLATGYNTIDVQAAAAKNIVVTNVPAYSTAAVAQFVFALLLEFCSHVQKHSDSVHRGEWVRAKNFTYSLTPLTELDGKTFGIYGFGSIGSRVARIAQAIGMRVICNTRTPAKIPADSGVISVSADELLKQSDIISLHAPLTESTKDFVNKNSIAKMKTGVIVINTSRGPLVNEADMRFALDAGKIGGFAADVISQEPMKQDNPLLGAPNCILTPHIAWAAKETRQRLMTIAMGNIESFIRGTPQNVVN